MGIIIDGDVNTTPLGLIRVGGVVVVCVYMCVCVCVCGISDIVICMSACWSIFGGLKILNFNIFWFSEK